MTKEDYLLKVKRENNTVYFIYAEFNEGPNIKVGTCKRVNTGDWSDGKGGWKITASHVGYYSRKEHECATWCFQAFKKSLGKRVDRKFYMTEGYILTGNNIFN